MQAAQPLVTDDIFTQDMGNHQLEWNTGQVYLPSRSERISEATYSYGVSPYLDAFAGMPVRLSSPGGIGDASVGLKWRFYESANTGMAFRASLFLPTGKAERGLGNGETGGALTWIGSLMLKSLSLHLNIGADYYGYRLRADRDANQQLVWRASTAALWRFQRQWQLVADTGIERNAERGNSTLPAFMLAGFIFSPDRDVDLDVGLRVGLNCRECPGQARRRLLAGLTWRF